MGQQAPQGRASYGLGGSSGVSGCPRGWAMDDFGSHFGVHFGSLFGPFWCLNSGALLGSSRVLPGLQLGSISGAFLDQNRAKSGPGNGPGRACPQGGGLGQKWVRNHVLGIQKMLKIALFLLVFLRLAALARGVCEGLKMDETVTKNGPKWGPKCIIFGPTAGSEGFCP